MNLIPYLSPPPSSLSLVTNLVFTSKMVALDGYHFKNCAFVECALQTAKGNFRLQECYLQGGFWLDFRGDAQRVARLASIVDWSKATDAVTATFHANGGVSIL